MAEDAWDVRLFDPIRIFGIRIECDSQLASVYRIQAYDVNGQQCYRSIYPVAAANGIPDDRMHMCEGSAEADKMHSNT